MLLIDEITVSLFLATLPTSFCQTIPERGFMLFEGGSICNNPADNYRLP